MTLNVLLIDYCFYVTFINVTFHMYGYMYMKVQ